MSDQLSATPPTHTTLPTPPAHRADPKFEAVKSKIVSLITQEFGRNRLELSNMMAVFFVLGQARNEGELLMLAKIFATDFPVLNEFLDEQKAVTQEKMEQDIQKMVQIIVKENPILAAQIAQEGMQDGMTVAKLLELHPELNKYKNQ